MNEDYRLAKVYSELGNSEAALELYQQCLQTFPHHAALLLRLAECYYTLERDDDCRSMMDKILQLPSLSCRQSLRVGQLLFDLEEYKKALRVFLKGHKRYPTDYDLNLEIGNCYSVLGNHTKEVEYTRAAIQISNIRVEAYFNLGKVYLDLGRYKESIIVFKQALSRDTADASIYYYLANNYFELDRLDEAVDYLHKTIQVDAEFHRGHYMLGVLHMEQGLYTEAIPYFETHLSHRPETVEAHYYVGDCYFETQQYDAAVACYQQVITLNPFDDYAYYDLATAHALLGDTRDALHALEKAISINAEENKREARRDPNFVVLKDDPTFKRLVDPKEIAEHS